MDISDLETGEKKRSTASNLIQIAFLLPLTLGMMYGLYKFVAFTFSQGSSQSCGGGASMAQIMAQNFVKRDLKAPSTASFTRSNVEAGKDCTFRVTGAVDAQNSFGAMLRTSYSITLQYNAETEKWQKLR